MGAANERWRYIVMQPLFGGAHPQNDPWGWPSHICFRWECGLLCDVIIMATLCMMWRSYIRLLEKYPWRTQAANTCILMGTGDFIAQAAIERRTATNYDGPRSLRFLGVGFFIAGPGMHWWYSNLDRFVKGSRKMVTAKKVLWDQLLFLPFYLGAFVSLMAVLRREKLPEIREHLERDYWPMLKTSYAIWPVVQVVNFYLVPNNHRVLVINFVGLIWNTYLSWRSECNVKLIHEHQQQLHEQKVHHGQQLHGQSKQVVVQAAEKWASGCVSHGPVFFCILFGVLEVSLGCARPITGQVTSVTWPVIGWA